MEFLFFFFNLLAFSYLWLFHFDVGVVNARRHSGRYTPGISILSLRGLDDESP